MKDRVIIIGNAGAARECYWMLREILPKREDLVFGGFLAFEGFAGNLSDLAHFSLGSDDDYLSSPQDVFIIGIGLPALRLNAYHKWKERGGRFINLVHPTVIIRENAVVGEGNIFTKDTFVSCDVKIGHANYLNGTVIVGHDARIGDGNFFGTFSIILADACIGSGNSLGVHATVLPKAKIGDDNIIAPGAYVYKGCGDNCVMAGNPALKI
ncbi:MAG: transferase [Desulfovibrio sp.]|nr:transferase [Desulfovibrio sp.]